MFECVTKSFYFNFRISFHWWRVIHEFKPHLVENNLHIYYFFHFNGFFPKACPNI